jgi:hypothetical protein
MLAAKFFGGFARNHLPGVGNTGREGEIDDKNASRSCNVYILVYTFDKICLYTSARPLLHEEAFCMGLEENILWAVDKKCQ